MAARRKLIVGIDPGTTVAFAALDFGRNVVGLWSRRDAGREEVVAALREVGDPAIVATDVSAAPAFVLKVASDFNARLFIPPRDMREAEKAHLSRGTGFANLHERDALASAFKAYNSVSNVLRKVERTLKENGLADKVCEAQSLALCGVRVDDAIGFFTPPEEAAPGAAGSAAAGGGLAAGPAVRRLESELAKRNERIRGLLVAVAELQKSGERLEAEKRELLQRIASLRSGAMDRILLDGELRKSRAEAERAKALARALLSEARRQRGAKTPLKRQNEKKEVDLEGIISGYRESRERR